MSRGWVVLCVFALIAGRPFALAESARGQAASLAELDDPGAIDPIDGNVVADPGEGTVAAAALSPVVGVDLSATLAPPRAEPPDPLARDGRAEPPPWPFPTTHRRLSWLRTLRI